MLSSKSREKTDNIKSKYPFITADHFAKTTSKGEFDSQSSILEDDSDRRTRITIKQTNNALSDYDTYDKISKMWPFSK